MNKKTYGFAIIGIGAIGKVHADLIEQTDRAQLVAAFHENGQKAEAFAAPYECKAYTNLAEMLADPEVDIVCICTPSGQHATQAIACAEAGKHVIVEKPIDVTLDKATAMIEACRRSGVKLAVISQQRYNPDYREIKQRIERGDFGKLIIGSAAINWYRSQDYYDSGKWRGTWELDGGGALMNQGIHTIDILQHLVGTVESVYAHCQTSGHERIEVEDAAVATLQFSNGAIGTLTGTTCAYPGLNTRIEIFGKDGSCVFDNDTLAFSQTIHESPDEASSGPKEVAKLLSGDPMAAMGDLHSHQFADMIEAIEQNREPSINGEEALKPLKIILAIYESSRTGKPVRIQ